MMMTFSATYVAFTFLVRVKVDIISEGCNDPGIRGCGVASIRINGIERSYRKRGYNFVVLDISTGKSVVLIILGM
jgi:hypothetical protein